MMLPVICVALEARKSTKACLYGETATVRHVGELELSPELLHADFAGILELF